MSRSLSRRSLGAAAAAAALVAGVLPAATAAAATPSYTVTTLYFKVTVPNEAVGGTGTQTCTIVGDLYKPANATATARKPVILATNGFGGSKNDADLVNIAKVGTTRGYGALVYSGLGFGGSGCKISLDDPSYDGAAGSQLVSFLGGRKGIAFTDANLTSAFPEVTWVQRDKVAHDGKAHANDPRVGMIGGSYGGEIQFAIAADDPRLDAIIPLITWNDLSYSLAPNNTAFTRGVTYSNGAPGTEKEDWVSLFFGLGIVDGISGAQIDPTRNVGCPNFLLGACQAKAQLDALGYATQSTLDFARHASVSSYISKIRIPTLLAQGQADTLFNLQEAVATYRALKAQGTPVKMIWQSWGHSHGAYAPGENATDASLPDTYEGQRFFAWFDHYLKGRNVSTGPGFAYYRDWVAYSGSGPDTGQYGTAASFPVASTKALYLSGANALVTGNSAVQAGSASYSNVGGGVPTSYSETSEFQGNQIPNEDTPPTDAPGTFASWSTGPLAGNLDVAGMPTATVHISAPSVAATQATSPAAQLLFFAKVYDVAPDGSVNLVHRLIAPVRVPDVTKPVTVELPGIVHRFLAGHRIEFVMAATDAAYRNADPVQPVTVTTSPTAPSVFTLPVLSAAQATAALGG